MKGEANIEAYVEGAKAVAALERAAREEGETEGRLRAIRAAKAELSGALRKLTGGQLGEARRRLATETAQARAWKAQLEEAGPEGSEERDLLRAQERA